MVWRHLSYMPHWLPYPVPIIGTAVIIALAVLLYTGAVVFTKHSQESESERYRRRSFFTTIVVFVAGAAIVLLWAHTLKEKGTFLGLLGAGLAVALREPLLGLAARLAIFTGHIFTAGDRIEVQHMTGDVIDIGFFYTRMLEIGSWIGGDQYSGRLLLLPNSTLFGSPIMNYTQYLSCIWDEIKLPITYDSNLEAAIRILTDAGADYTKEFLKDAEHDLEEMKRKFLVPQVEFEPSVYVKITDNWIELTLRYVVRPRKRRAASSFLYQEIFKRIFGRKDIQIASETMDLTLRRSEAA